MRMMPSNFAFLARGRHGAPSDCAAEAARTHAARAQMVRAARMLPEGRLQRIEAVPGTRVACLTGRLWVTLAGDGEDHLLAPGDAFTAPTAGLLLAQALSTATFTVEDISAAARR